MNYTFTKCKNIRSLSNLTIRDTISSAKGTFAECENLTTVTNIQVLVNGSVADFFKGCYRLNKIILLSFPNTKYLTSVFEGCAALTVSPLENTSDNVLDIENIFKGSGITSLTNLTFSENIDDISSFFEGYISRVLNSNYTPKDTEEVTELSTQDDTVFELYQDVTNIHFNNNIKPKTVRVGYLDIE